MECSAYTTYPNVETVGLLNSVKQLTEVV